MNLIATFRSKLETGLWFLQRPELHRQALRIIWQRLAPHPKEDTRAQSTTWCRDRALTSEDAVAELLGEAAALRNVRDEHKDVFEEARELAARSPSRMGGPGDLNLLYLLAEACEAIRVIETGVAYGWSSLALLLSLDRRQGSRLVSIDMPYAKRGTEDFVGCAIPDRLRASWTLLRLPDQDALEAAIAELGSLDLCHYDSDKSYVGRMWAYPRLWRALRAGGWFVSDDIQDNVAFQNFAESLGLSPLIVECGGKFVGVIQKPSA
jgi:predicted O-methyltransferase YrrM